ncbi:peptidylprolyl isomerase [Puniceicoccaceae bacterium K14]|nr:peptidylprolyl isomerase [Puniceicoccaceae bacterium K14]
MTASTSLTMFKSISLITCLLALSSPIYSQTLVKSAEAASKVGTRFANGIAAIVEDKIITVEDIRRELQPLLPQIQAQANNNPEAFRQLLEQAENDVIQMLTDNELIVKEFFEQDGATIPYSYIENQREEEIITRFEGDRSKFLGYLKSIGKTPDEYDEGIRNEIIVSFMSGRMRKTQSFISPVKIEEFYKENQQEFHLKEAIKLRMIKLSQVADEGPEILEQSAKRIISELDDGADFAELAKTHSQDSKARKGGDWGWVEKGALIEKLSTLAFSLQPGQYSEEPINLGSNYFILFVEDYRPEGFEELENLRDQIENMLISQEAQLAQQRWLERLRRDGYVRRFN